MPPTTTIRSGGPTPLPRSSSTTSGSSSSSTSSLALEKVIQDHIPHVSLHLQRLLYLLSPPNFPTAPLSRRSLSIFERDLRRLCHLAQDGVRRMDVELRTIEAGWDLVDKQRWEVCRRDYRGVMKLVQMVWEAGQGRVEELRQVRVSAEGDSAGRRTVVRAPG